MSCSILTDPRLYVTLLQIDLSLAEEVKQKRCRHCSGRLDRARYPRKPRAPISLGREHHFRESFCCAEEGCRCRTTPPSVRFLGRRVYVALVVVLTTASSRSFNAACVQKLVEQLGVDRATLRRWQAWWRETVPDTSFWKTGRSRFMPPVDETQLPGSLVDAFGADTQDRLVALLCFVSPLFKGSL
jgi:hypothetical protein